MKKRVEIFYASYGGGHLSAAKSIKQYIDEEYSDEYETHILDIVEYCSKIVNKISKSAYNRMAKDATWAWERVYYKSQKGTLAKISNTSNKIMAVKMSRYFRENKPDIVINTHPFGSQITSYLKAKNKTNCKLYTILTDFVSHNQWLVGSENVDKFFVSNQLMKEDIVKESNIPEEKIEVTGIPISKRFLEPHDKEKIFKELDLSPEKKTILFFGGGAYGLGKDKTEKILSSLTNLENIQIIAISGKNEDMYNSFKRIVSKSGKEDSIKVIQFANNVPELMSISNLVITKPGGLTISESLVSGLPIMIINPLPGQEEENADFLEKSGSAIWLRKVEDSKTILSLLFMNDDNLLKMHEASLKIAKPHSTETICKEILG